MNVRLVPRLCLARALGLLCIPLACGSTPTSTHADAASATGGATSAGGSGGNLGSGGGSSSTGGATGSGGATTGSGAQGSGGTAGATAGTGGRSGAGGGVTSTGGSASGTGGAAGGIGGAGTGGAGTGTCAGGAATAGDVVVNLADVHQKISGFGASTAWGSTMSAADADLLWSTTSGAGLSLHRIRIDYKTGQTSEVNIAKLAVARGVTVWATPWTPPAADKTGATGANGEVEGTLSNGQAFATFLAGFVSYMKGQGVNIYAVSAQNEPDANVTYESCAYTPATLASFIGTYMGPALATSGAKIIGPETQNWCGFQAYADAIANNPAAAMYTSIIATHEYGCVDASHMIAYGQKVGKEFWETEVYDEGKTQDPGIGSGLVVAKMIHDALTIASMNAWHYWWVYPTSTTLNGALWDNMTNQPAKRLWAMGNYSRFVRPGWQRVGTTGTAPSGVLLSAYKNPTDGAVAIVAVNNNSTATSLSTFVSGAAPCSVIPWVTSAADNLAAKPAVAITGGRFTTSLAAKSVTTFVGKP